ncbi:nuclear transport factor 2 family protein [Arcticibacter sp. MXS-1]|uniref:nuclear transport factor 2 family protein n=1 Tax=Arcticibacter sp. MXS-1 TaxID=3341726 RepID=UPI0035A85309
MKALKTIITAFCIALSFTVFSKDDGAKDQKLSMSYAVQTYIDAMTLGKIKDFGEVLDNDVKFTMTQGQKIVNFNRAQMLSALKGSENMEQNCKTSYSVVEQNDAQSIVKVTMTYDVFTRTNYVTISHTDKGWKITNVSSVFN